VLFYREHQSIETVAANLELSEDAVKQRLSRGRKLLQEQVLAFVEGALERTNPGKVFTIGVLAALPVTFAASAKAATIGTGAVKGGLLAKTAVATGLFSLVANPVMMLFGNYASYRANLAEAQSEMERQRIKAIYRKALFVALGVFAVFAGTAFWLCRNQSSSTLLITALVVGMILIYLATTLLFAVLAGPGRRKALSEMMARDPSGGFRQPAFEYRSRAGFLGLPLVHIRIGDRFALLNAPVKAWFAVGERAMGGLFAFGAIAIAPVSIGGITIGLLPFGGLALGVLALGGFAVGIWSYGGLVLGWQALGGFALGWQAADGGVALARDFAVGGIARAAGANTEVARYFINNQWFFHYGEILARHSFWVNLVWVLPLMMFWNLSERKNRRKTGQEI
jgi:hypothetical protein